MFGTIATAAKMKAIITACALVLSGVGFYEVVGEQSMQGNIIASEKIDPFTEDIQERSDLVYNAVLEAVNQQGKQAPLVYKQTCESSVSFIQNERLDTNNGYNTLDAGQKELITNYREYLKEAASVVSVAYSGSTPDLTKMNELKAKLY